MPAVVADKVVVELEARRQQYDRDVNASRQNFERSMDLTTKSARQTERQVGQSTLQLTNDLKRRYRDLGMDIGRTFKDISGYARIAFIGITAYALKLAADAAEIESAFDVAFKSGSKSAREFADVLANKVGRDAVELRQSMTRLQLILTGTGVAAGQALELTKALATAGIDAGSLFNTSDAEALQKIISGLSGEAEPLKAFGVVITEAATKAELLRLGFKGNAEAASEAAKSIARANLILKGLAVAQGDATRTADSAANKTRAMTAEFNKAARDLGTQLLPMAIKVVGSLTALLKAFNDMPGGVQIAALSILAFIAAGGPIAGLLANLGKVIKLARDARLAIASIAGANAILTGSAAGGAVGAGGLAAGVAGLEATAGVGLVALPLFISHDEVDAYHRARKNPKGASAADLAAGIKYAQGFIKNAGGAGNGPSEIRTIVEENLRTLQAEAMRRASLPGAGGAATSPPVDTSVIGGFSLTPAQMRPATGTGAGRKKSAGSREDQLAAAGLVDADKYAAEVNPDTVVDINALLKAQLEKMIVQADASPTGFKPAGEAIADMIGPQTEAYNQLRDNWAQSFADGMIQGIKTGDWGEVLQNALMQWATAGLQSAFQDIGGRFYDLISGGPMHNGGTGGSGGGSFLSSVGSFISSMIPGHASGTPGAPGGWSWVGERGPELVNLPRGSQVLPNHQSMAMARQSSGPSQMRLHVSVDVSGANGDRAVEAIAQRAAARGAIEAFKASRQAYPDTAQSYDLLGSV